MSGAASVMVAIALAVLPQTALALTDDFAAPLSSQWAPPHLGEPGASVTSPVSDATAADGEVLELKFPGGTSPQDGGPAFSTQLQTTDTFAYGTYTARLRTPKASPSTGLVSGFFTYFNDGIDHDGDSIIDNDEIDVEILAAEPSVIYLTVWTEYQFDGTTETFHKVTRKIDLRSGRVWQTPPGGENTYALEEIARLGWKMGHFRAWRGFHTYRFVWSPDSVEYAIDLEDGTGFRTLWTLTGAPNVTIPTIPAPLYFNLWHNARHWKSGRAARVPKRDVSMEVDSVSVE